jgi:hypothetical protein
MNTHLEEKSALVECAILGRETIIQARAQPHPPAIQGVALGCYRTMLCESEDRDCWYAQPQKSKAEPFDYNSAAIHIRESGEVFASGMNPVVLIMQSDLSVPRKRVMLEELIRNAPEFAAYNYMPEEAQAALDSIAN